VLFKFIIRYSELRHFTLLMKIRMKFNLKAISIFIILSLDLLIGIIYADPIINYKQGKNGRVNLLGKNYSKRFK